jgi:hypothetical protein
MPPGWHGRSKSEGTGGQQVQAGFLCEDGRLRLLARRRLWQQWRQGCPRAGGSKCGQWMVRRVQAGGEEGHSDWAVAMLPGSGQAVDNMPRRRGAGKNSHSYVDHVPPRNVKSALALVVRLLLEHAKVPEDKSVTEDSAMKIIKNTSKDDIFIPIHLTRSTLLLLALLLIFCPCYNCLIHMLKSLQMLHPLHGLAEICQLTWFHPVWESILWYSTKNYICSVHKQSTLNTRLII